MAKGEQHQPAARLVMTPGQRFKTSFFKTLPIAAGVLFGVIVVKPPAALAALGWPLYVLAGLLLVAFLAGLVVMLVSANLPSKLELKPREHATLSGQVGSFVSQLRGLGFRDVGAPLEVGTAPPATLVAFTHNDGLSYATVFLPGQRGADPVFDFSSILAGGRGSLVTAATTAASQLPARRTALRQIFPKRSIEDTYAKHRKSLLALRARGVDVREVSDSTFEDDYRAAFAALRAEFFRRPVRNAFVTLWRAITGRSKELGLVVERPGAAAVIDELAASSTPTGPESG